ncbi:MAG: acetylxylan esterase [Planctomycetes bacterium]|nr:acetylxylan esterase [Planctomycetota bacterium]
MQLGSPHIEVGRLAHPSGGERCALILPCKGFAANSLDFAFMPKAIAENLVVDPELSVISSDDPKGRSVEGPTRGVLNPVYTKDTKLDFHLSFGWRHSAPFSGAVELVITHAFGQEHFRIVQELKMLCPGNDGTIRVSFHPGFSLPGVSDVSVRLMDEEGRQIWMDGYRMAYAIEETPPVLRAPADLREFWDQTLEELRAIPLMPKVERKFEDCESHEIFEVTYNSWGAKRIYAMMFVPKNQPRPLPALVTAHPNIKGYGVSLESGESYGTRVSCDTRFVTLVPLIRGHAPDALDIPMTHRWWGPLNSREDFVGRDWYCALARAVDYLESRSDLVDMKRVLSSGGSFGGALALALAALDPRVSYCMSDCPSCSRPGELSLPGDEWIPLSEVAPGKTMEQVKGIFSYYNTINLCPWIRCPTLIGANIGDLTVHSMNAILAYRNLTGLSPDQKEFCPGFTTQHGSGPGYRQRHASIMHEVAEGVKERGR